MNKSIETTPVDLRKYHEKRLIQRDIDQLLGICEFALLDGLVDQTEAECMLGWLHNHPDCTDVWPANILYERLVRMLDNGVIDDQEQGELLRLMLSISRPPTPESGQSPSTLPLDSPEPVIIINNRRFCFTGVFEFGSRDDCISAITARGGEAIKGITKKLDYLVIGKLGSEFWRHSSFGGKIAKAVEYRDAGAPVAIVSEDHWKRSINV